MTEQSVAEITSKAESGDAEAQYQLGLMYEDGKVVDWLMDEALKWWKKAGEQNHIQAQRKLAYWYQRRHDIKNAIKWYKKLAEIGDKDAIYNLAKMLGKQHPEEAIEYYSKIADQANSQFDLAEIYLRKKDFTKAEEWYQKAADQELNDARYRLARLYVKGDKIPENRIKAFDLYKQAAETGHNLSQRELGDLYWFDNKDYKQAFECFAKAAIKGDVFSRSRLSAMYKNGNLVEKNILYAYMCFIFKPVEKFNYDYDDLSERACYEINKTEKTLKESLSPEELVQAEELAKTWQPSLSDLII